VIGPDTGCQFCGVGAETRYVEFHQNVGLLVARLHSSVKGHLCKACISHHFWGKTATTLFLGWWGVISFFATPFILLNNVVRYLPCRGMAAPPDRGSGPAVGPGGGGRPPQLVGQKCARCGERISCDLDGRFCRACGAPVHDQCARPGEGPGCPACGSAAATA
jgi:hypothetical protein